MGFKYKLTNSTHKSFHPYNIYDPFYNLFIFYGRLKFYARTSAPFLFLRPKRGAKRASIEALDATYRRKNRKKRMSPAPFIFSLIYTPNNILIFFSNLFD